MTPGTVELILRLRTKAAMIELGEKIAWGSDSALMLEAADALQAPLASPPELLAALKEAQYFILAPAEDLKDGVLSRIREAISKAEGRS